MSEQAQRHDEVDHDAFETEQHQGIRTWVSEQLGSEVQAIERLERWRPQWKVSFTKDGENEAVFVRGNRPIAGENDLRFEMEVMKVLEANGILVPHIYGWMDSPKAFVMDWVDTDDRALVAPDAGHLAMLDHIDTTHVGTAGKTPGNRIMAHRAATPLHQPAHDRKAGCRLRRSNECSTDPRFHRAERE